MVSVYTVEIKTGGTIQVAHVSETGTGQWKDISNGRHVVMPVPPTALYKDVNGNTVYVDKTQTVNQGTSYTTYWQASYKKTDGTYVTANEMMNIEEKFPSGATVSTQQAAQESLVAINNAIVSKDKIRAHLGAMQNRLENTITNLNVQAENLQASESRISDVDVVTEMTNFVRPQCPGRKPPGIRIPHIRRGCSHGNDEFRPQSNSYAIGCSHAGSG